MAGQKLQSSTGAKKVIPQDICFLNAIPVKTGLVCSYMAKKQNAKDDVQLLELLKTVLPKAVSDPKLVQKIYSACEQEIKAKNRAVSFEKFCDRCELPDLKPESIGEVQRQLEESFGKGKVSVVPHPGKKAATVEVVTPDETYEGIIRVKGAEETEAEQEEEVKAKMMPFPVALETDPELVWVLARQETLSTKEAAITLDRLQDDFWGSKAGQKLQQDRVEKTFAEFIARVPGKMLSESGIKRHYKEPEALKQLRALKPMKGK